MTVSTDNGSTRMLVMGSASFTDGFSLLGIEAYPDATQNDVERVLTAILEGEGEALVILEHYLSQCDSSVLRRCRMECSRVVVVEVPSLHAPDDYHPEVEELVKKTLGPAALEID